MIEEQRLGLPLYYAALPAPQPLPALESRKNHLGERSGTHAANRNKLCERFFPIELCMLPRFSSPVNVARWDSWDASPLSPMPLYYILQCFVKGRVWEIVCSRFGRFSVTDTFIASAGASVFLTNQILIFGRAHLRGSVVGVVGGKEGGLIDGPTIRQEVSTSSSSSSISHPWARCRNSEYLHEKERERERGRACPKPGYTLFEPDASPRLGMGGGGDDKNGVDIVKFEAAKEEIYLWFLPWDFDRLGKIVLVWRLCRKESNYSVLPP